MKQLVLSLAGFETTDWRTARSQRRAVRQEADPLKIQEEFRLAMEQLALHGLEQLRRGRQPSLPRTEESCWSSRDPRRNFADAIQLLTLREHCTNTAAPQFHSPQIQNGHMVVQPTLNVNPVTIIQGLSEFCRSLRHGVVFDGQRLRLNGMPRMIHFNAKGLPVSVGSRTDPIRTAHQWCERMEARLNAHAL